MACCDLVDDGGGIFKPLSKRCCTDIICLLIFFVYLAGMIVIGIISLTQGQMDYVFYPLDYKNKFCGKDSAVSGRPYAYYPRLDRDIIEQMPLLTSPTGFLYFQPYTLCVAECPPAFSLSSPNKYGGPNYPGANTTDEAYYNMNPTSRVFNRCLPATQLNPGLNRKICGSPSCGDAATRTCLEALADSSLRTPECTSVASDEGLGTNNIWEVKPGQESCCDFLVQEMNTQSFMPPDATPETRIFEEQFAEYVASAFGLARSIQENFTQVMVMGVAAPFGFALAWFLLLFLFAGFLIIMALLLFLVALIAMAGYFYYKAGWVSTAAITASVSNSVSNLSQVNIVTTSTSDDIGQMWYAVLAVLATIGVIAYVIFLVLGRQAIFRCIAIVREVTKVLFSLPFMCVWPLVSVVFYLGVLAYLIVISCFIITENESNFEQIAAMGAAYANGTAGASAFSDFTNLDQNVRIVIFLIIHIIGCIWALYITMGATYTTLSRSAAVWFFSHGDDGTGNVVLKKSFAGGVNVVLSCAYCIITRHLGSVCFGAAILTIMTVLRMILQAIDYYTKDMQGSNLLLRIVMKCAQCCLYCMDRTVKFITYYGYIFVAIEGTSFCGACLATFSFIMKYPAQMSVNNLVSKILSFVISLSIPIACATVGFIWVDQVDGFSPLYASCFIFILAFVIAMAITDVFRCCIDTIFVCAFKDMEEHTPPKYMSSALRAGFGLDTASSGPTVQKGAEART
jgi:hypothetical protein